MRRAVDNASLERWRQLDAQAVLDSLGCYSKEDPSFHPARSRTTTRVHVTADDAEFELLLTGPKFFDTRADRGGGGAVDLVMHLYGVDFRAAVRRLQEVL